MKITVRNVEDKLEQMRVPAREPLWKLFQSSSQEQVN